MSEKTTNGKEPARRTTISLNPKVFQWAEELVKEDAHNSISDLITDLIRRRKERQEIKEGIYPAHVEQYSQAAETPSPAVEEDKGRKKAKGR